MDELRKQVVVHKQVVLGMQAVHRMQVVLGMQHRLDVLLVLGILHQLHALRLELDILHQLLDNHLDDMIRQLLDMLLLHQLLDMLLLLHGDKVHRPLNALDMSFEIVDYILPDELAVDYRHLVELVDYVDCRHLAVQVVHL